MTQRWLTIHTKPQAEARAYVGIHNSGFTVFAPFEMVRYIDRGVTCRKALPLFGPYLFARMEPDRMTQLDGIEGIIGILRDDHNKPRFADEDKIEKLRRAQQMGAFDNARDDWAKAGDDVRIADTALLGFVAKVKRTTRHKRVELVCGDVPFRITASIDKLEKIRA